MQQPFLSKRSSIPVSLPSPQSTSHSPAPNGRHIAMPKAALTAHANGPHRNAHARAASNIVFSISEERKAAATTATAASLGKGHKKSSSTTSLPMPTSARSRSSMTSLLDTLDDSHSPTSRTPSSRPSSRNTSPSSIYSTRSGASSPRSRLPTPTSTANKKKSIASSVIHESFEDVDLKTPPRSKSSFSEVADKAAAKALIAKAAQKTVTPAAVPKKPETDKPAAGQAQSRLGAVKRMFSLKKKQQPTNTSANRESRSAAKGDAAAPANANPRTVRAIPTTAAAEPKAEPQQKPESHTNGATQLAQRTRESLHGALAAARDAERKSRATTHRLGLVRDNAAVANASTYAIRHGLMQSRQKLQRYGQLAAEAGSSPLATGKIPVPAFQGAADPEMVRDSLKMAQCTPLLGYSVPPSVGFQKPHTLELPSDDDKENRDPAAMGPSSKPRSLPDLECLRKSREDQMVRLFRFCESWSRAACGRENGQEKCDPLETFTAFALLERLCAFLKSDGTYFVATRQVLRKAAGEMPVANKKGEAVLRDDVWSERFAARKQMVDVLGEVLLCSEENGIEVDAGGWLHGAERDLLSTATWSDLFTALEALFAKDVKIVGGLLGLYGSR